jgi:ribosome maturation factor RimP
VLPSGHSFSRRALPGGSTGSGRSPTFFMSFVTEETVKEVQTEIEQRLAESEPNVEVLLAVVLAGGILRLFIDHPEGVTLALCERVSAHLNDYRDRYDLEVSSPGSKRPLTKPQHYSRFLGRHARVRLREARDGHKSVTGELVGASERDVTIAAGDGIVTIPYDEIARSNLVPGD